MLFTTLNGRQRDVSITPYRIDWTPEREISRPTALTKAFLRPYWECDTVLSEFRVPATRLRLDLFNVNQGIVIEISPRQHFAYNPHFHGSLSGYRASIKRDLLKQDWCRLNALTFIELTEEDLGMLSAELFLERFGVTL